MLGGQNTYKYLDIMCDRFYNCRKILTFNRILNIITGSRGTGKSTSVGAFCLLDYVLNGHKFIYVRRDDDELRQTRDTFFDNPFAILKAHFPELFKKFRGVTCRKGLFFLEKGEKEQEECGKAIALSMEHKHKSSNFSEYCTIIYDEFIAQRPTGYLGKMQDPDIEYSKLMSLYQTVDRGIGTPRREETRIFLMGNTATVYNPIFLTLNICDYITEGARFIRPKNKQWVLEMIDTVPALEGYENTGIYSLLTEKERDYSYRNKGSDVNKAFIKKLPQVKISECNLIIQGDSYGVWTDNDHITYYIGKPSPYAKSYSLDLKSHGDTDLQLITRMNELFIMRLIVDKFRHGSLFFANGKAYKAFINYLKFSPGV